PNELLDRLHLADVLLVVGGLAVHGRLLLDAAERGRQVAHDQLVARKSVHACGRSNASLQVTGTCLRETGCVRAGRTVARSSLTQGWPSSSGTRVWNRGRRRGYSDRYGGDARL